MKHLNVNWMDQVGEKKGIKFEHLMQQAKAKYHLLTFLSKWGTKSQEQEELITLKAQILLSISPKAFKKTKGKIKKEKSKNVQKKNEE